MTEQHRRKWVFAELGGGSFTRMDDGTWILEAAGEPTVSKFREVTDPYDYDRFVDLVGIDPPGVRNRIYDDHFETMGGDGYWRRVFDGHWE